MMYLIFRNGRYIGFSYKRNYVTLLRRQRGNHFTIHKVNKSDIAKIMNTDPTFASTQLEIFPEHNNRMLFLFEERRFNQAMFLMVIEFIKIGEELKECLKFLKITDEERINIARFILVYERIIADVSGPEPSVSFSEYFSIDSVLDKITKL